MNADVPPADTAFDILTEVTLISPNRYRALLPDGWQQGRGLFGGLVAATMVRAFEKACPERPLRSLTAEMCGPVQPGACDIAVETLRAGSAVSTLAARLLQGDGIQAHAVGVMGNSRSNVAELTQLHTPTMPAWREMDVLPVQPPLGPDFANYFEYRSHTIPFAGLTKTAAVEGWVRPKFPGAARGAAFLAGCIDAYWPAEFALMEMPRPMATIAFTFQPLGSFEGLDMEAPLFFRSQVGASRQGYAVEFRELWGEDGRLLALNQQTMCTIK